MLGCRPLSVEEQSALLLHLRSNRDRCLFILGCRTGLRISELLSLRISDVSSATGVVLDRITVQRRNTKGKLAGRSIILHYEAKNALLTWLGEYPATSHSPLFPSCRKGFNRVYLNKPMTRASWWRIMKEAVDKAGLQGKIATHSMRKTFAKRVYEGLDKDLLKTRVALGHKNIDSTISYLSFDTIEIDEVILQ